MENRESGIEHRPLSLATAKTYLRSSILDLRSLIRVDWLVHGAVALVFSGVLLAYIQFAGPNIVDYDGYYHIKMAELIREQGIPVKFPWLKFTIIDEQGYTDHHLLLHIFQIPFTYLGYVYSGTQGTVQFLAYTGRNLVKEYEADFLELLGGLVIE